MTRKRPARPFAPRPLRVAPGGEAAAEPSTVFLWARERRVWLYLSAFLLFSAMLHGAGFYLFQVVYPPAVRYDPEPDSVSLLDRGDPSARALLREIRDRTVHLTPPSEELGGEVRLTDFEIRFAPSFSPPEVEPLEARYPWSLPPEVGAGPSIPAPPTSPPGEASPIALGGGLETLSIAPWSILGHYLERAEDLPRLRLGLAAGPSGEVSVESITPMLEPADFEALARLVESTLRFLPTEGGADGWIEIGEEGTD